MMNGLSRLSSGRQARRTPGPRGRLDDYPAGLPQSDAVNQRWQQRMAGLLETVHDYSEDGSEAVLPVVWQLWR